MNNKNNKLYCQVGETLHLCQTLELQIHALISILNNNFDADIDENGLILKEDNKTLGMLIHELKKHGSLDESGSKILKDALENRNYIIHHFFNKNVYALTNESIFRSTMNNLKECSKTIALATAITQGFLLSFCKVLKISLKEILVKQNINEGVE